MYMDTVIDGILKGLQKQFFVMIINIIDLVMTILILYFLLPVIGVFGFVISIVISEIFNFTLSFFQLWKVTKFKIDLKNYILKPILSSVFSYCILHVFSLINTSSIFNLILSIFMFSCIYFLMYVLLKLNLKRFI